MRRRTAGTVRTVVEMSCLRSWPFVKDGWRRYVRPWRPWKPRRRRQQSGPRSEGKEHPSVPEDRSQRNFTAAESRIMPAPGGRDFVQAYNCQAVVDSANQVIVAARATNDDL